MDATAPSPEGSRELAELRKRAYGPDADIDDDPVALRRLLELEALLHVEAPTTVDGDEGAADQTVAELVSPVRRTIVDAGEPAPVSESAAAAVAPSTPPRPPRWWQRMPRWVVIVAVGVIGIVVGLVMTVTSSPRPDAILKPVSGVDPGLRVQWRQTISHWVTIDAEPVQHEPYHRLSVLSASSQDGMSCLIVTWRDHFSDYSCTPPGILPVVDFVSYVGGPQPLDQPLPTGSVIRFTLTGDNVEVTLAKPPTG